MEAATGRFWPIAAVQYFPKAVIRAAGFGKSSRSSSVRRKGQNLPLGVRIVPAVCVPVEASTSKLVNCESPRAFRRLIFVSHAASTVQSVDP
jgi:hypothetical protein